MGGWENRQPYPQMDMPDLPAGHGSKEKAPIATPPGGEKRHSLKYIKLV
jgi:hypothetical protein